MVEKMYRPESLIIDNDKLKLSEELNKILAEQKNLDIATAFFNIQGFCLIKESLTGCTHFRLLLGVTPQSGEEKPDFFIPEQIYKQSIRVDLEETPFEKAQKDTTVDLINFLAKSSVEVRLYDKGFLHGKVYIFDKLAILGSSNFTYSGFTSNTELNAVLDEAHTRYIREEWFQKIWDRSVDFKQQFISIFDESKFGTKEYSPYSIFIKALFELQKDDIEFEYETPTALPPSEVNLANFQDDAVRRIYSRLELYNGVLIADSVGLGKTWIAKKVIEDFGFYRRRRFAVVCPASVDETLWRPALKEIGLSESIIHQEELGRLDYDYDQLQSKLGFKLEEIALFVIDESHNFRNPLSNRYEGLYTFIEKASKHQTPKILLLTATPMNNTYWDLYFQLQLIAHNDNRIFLKEGIFDLEKQFRKADKGNITHISDILQVIAIRRTRQYIQNNYADAKFKDEKDNWVKISFPKRELKEITYSLDATYQGLYHNIADKIEKGLTLAYYRLEDYRVVGKKDSMELGRMQALGGILQIILLKRLESSVEAFRRSIQTQIDFLETFKQFFAQGKILRKKYYNKYLVYIEEGLDSADDIMAELENNLELIKLNEYNIDQFYTDLDKDIQIFESIKALVSPIIETKDAKLEALKNKILEIKDEGKILIFSFYSDTIDYLFEGLNKDNGFQSKFNKKIAKVTGSFPMHRRKAIIDEFLNSDTDLLFSTDILSEGQNLQKARIVINYDLHWNPVRMIQRAGRIDRIGSPFNKIYIHNFYPEQELESLLELVKILQNKISMINDTIGLDSSVMGEVINPKVFGIIRDLRSTEEKKEETLKILEEQQFGGGELFWQPLKDFGLDNLKSYCESLPHGIQSGIKKGFRGVFFYYKYDETFHLWLLYDITNKDFITNKTEIVNFISCSVDESRVMPEEIDIFEIHKKVRDEIEKFFSEGLITTQIRTTHGRVEKFLADMRDELDMIRAEFPDVNDQLREKISCYISSINNIALTKKRMQILRRIWRDYKNSNNWHVLISKLGLFLEDKTIIETPEAKPFDEMKLKLICVDYIS